MSDDPTDVGACLAGIARGDPEAARILVERCDGLVVRIVRAHRPRTIPVEDLVQEGYLKLFSHLRQYQPRDGVPFEHWLSRLAVRTCLDALRHERRRPWSRSVDASPGAGAWLESLVADGQAPVDDALGARELVNVLLARLPPEDRLVLSLLDLAEHTVAEVSQMTGWSRTLVRVRAFRARRRLQDAAAKLALGRDHD